MAKRGRPPKSAKEVKNKPARAPAAETPPAKSAAAKPAKTLKRRICFFFQALTHMQPADEQNALCVVAMPEPARADMQRALEAEIKMVMGENAFAYQTAITGLIKAYDEGRALFGWAPFRAKRAQREPLTWKEWDAFCAKWFGEAKPSPNRRLNCSEDALTEEALYLESLQLVKIEGEVPGEIGKKRATA